METLPNELKLNILKQTDFQSLKALVHASPNYHALYQSCRLEILTSATLHDLKDKNINLDLPVRRYEDENRNLPTYRLLVLCVPVRPPMREPLRAALTSYYTQLERRDLIRLSVEHCAAIRGINEMNGRLLQSGTENCYAGDAVGGVHFRIVSLDGTRRCWKCKGCWHLRWGYSTPGESSGVKEARKTRDVVIVSL